MRGYEDDEYEDYDDYEEEEYEQGKGGYEDGEYEEQEEEPKPTKEVLDYLELRQKLKESIRKRMKKEASASQELKKDNYGSFFGPSKPVIAQRVIQESKSLLENPHLAARVLKTHQNGNKNSSSKPSGSKSGVRPLAPRVNELKQRVQKIKDTRDYSFLLSEDAELPALSKQPPQRSVPAPSSSARPVKPASQSIRTPASNARHAKGGTEERRTSANSHSNSRSGPSDRLSYPRPGSGNPRRGSINVHSNPRPGFANGHSTNRPGSPHGHSVHKPSSSDLKTHRSGSMSEHNTHRPVPANGHSTHRLEPATGHSNPRPAPSKLTSDSKPQIAASRKQLGNNSGNGPSRPAGSSGLQLKKPVPPQQKVSLQSLKSSMSGMKPSAAKVQSSKYHMDPRWDTSTKHKVPPKQVVASNKPQLHTQMDRPQKQIMSHVRQHEQKIKKRPSRSFSDDDDDDGAAAITMIRKMFGYNPNKFAGRDEDDSDMEANFDDIMREEKRSARIAREEDEEQLRLIEEEERRERMRKKRKMG